MGRMHIVTAKKETNSSVCNMADFLKENGYENARRLGNTDNYLVDRVGKELDNVTIVLQKGGFANAELNI